jgi:glycosyltransferase involved in cell wall biosynthesis
MEPNRLLYLCDLNLKNGGAQRITYKTIGCLSKVFQIILYITDEPSPESLSLLNELRLEYVLDRDLDEQRLRSLISSKNIGLVLIQWENPKWIITLYRIKKSIGVKYAIFLYELPIIGVPTNKFIKNWYLLASGHHLKDAINIFFEMTERKSVPALHHYEDDKFSGGKGDPKKSVSESIRGLLRKITRVTDTYKGLMEAEKVISMGPASKFYIDNFLRLGNVAEVRHIASSDISVKDSVKNTHFSFDICYMARLEPRKGIFDVLEVVHRVKKMLDYEPRIAILGRFVDEKTRADFLRKSKKLKLEPNIYLPGFVSEDEKLEILGSSKVFLYPSKKDVFSISLADALSMGLPAVAYDMPFVTQFGNPGVYRVRLGDTKMMSRKVSEILGLCNSESIKYADLRKVIQEDFRSKFSWDITCNEQIQAINSLVANLHER